VVTVVVDEPDWGNLCPRHHLLRSWARIGHAGDLTEHGGVPLTHLAPSLKEPSSGNWPYSSRRWPAPSSLRSDAPHVRRSRPRRDLNVPLKRNTHS